MFNISTERLAKGSLWACLVGAIVTTAGEIWSKIRHDKREKQLYATIQLDIDEVKTKLLSDPDKNGEA